MAKRNIFSIQEIEEKAKNLLRETWSDYLGVSQEELDDIISKTINNIRQFLLKKDTELMAHLEISVRVDIRKHVCVFSYCRIDVSDIINDYLLLENKNLEKLEDLTPFVKITRPSSFYCMKQDQEKIDIRVSIFDDKRPENRQVKKLGDIIEYYYPRNLTKFFPRKVPKLVMDFRSFRKKMSSIVGEDFCANNNKTIAKLFTKTIKFKMNKKIPALLLLTGDTLYQNYITLLTMVIVTKDRIIVCKKQYSNCGNEKFGPKHGQDVVFNRFPWLNDSVLKNLISAIHVDYPYSWVELDVNRLKSILD